MFRFARMIFSVVTVLWCGLAQPASNGDADLFKKLVGSWTEARTVGCESHKQTIRLMSDSTFTVGGILTSCGDKPELFMFRGVWRVEGGYFRYTASYSSPGEFMPVGQEFADRILEVSENSWRMLESSTEKESQATRIK